MTQLASIDFSAGHSQRGKGVVVPTMPWPRDLEGLERRRTPDAHVTVLFACLLIVLSTSLIVGRELFPVPGDHIQV
jgi:hypothetical protein